MTQISTEAVLFDPHHGSWRPFTGDLPGQSRQLDSGVQSAFGIGFTRIDRSCRLALTVEWHLALYVISGKLHIDQGHEKPLIANSGDVLLLPKACRVLMTVVRHCHLFYAISPNADWRKALRPGS
jgi:ethanolamine utilization protein EutQ (cupin superfamily)